MINPGMFKKVETVRLEITPGYFIEVNPKSINPKKNKVRLNRTKNHDIERHRIFSDALRPKNGGIKYSSLILDEAVSLSLKKGVPYAAKKTGVKFWSIVQRKRRLSLAGLYVPKKTNPGRSKYTMEQKKRCVSLALQLTADPATKIVKRIDGRSMVMPKWALKPAFVEAGRRLGMNGLSIYHMHFEGMIK